MMLFCFNTVREREDPDAVIIEKGDSSSRPDVVHAIQDLEEKEEEEFYTPVSSPEHQNNSISVYSLISSFSSSIINLSAFNLSHRNLLREKESVTETGQSSNSDWESIFCPICMEPKSPNESFTIKGCSHVFCSDCMIKYVASKIQDNTARIQCPDLRCKGVLEPEFCRSILPPEVFERWGNVLFESLISGSMKFYCPYKDCSGLLLDERGGRVVIKESECPHCRRLFCAQCKVPWHSGIGCAQFQKLGKGEREREDIMLMNLAKNRNWQRCPECRFYVERLEGCPFMRCSSNAG
ncbi:uncharacterized protein LOC143863701 isoform X2 [Tasmannia lanceolata]|uniref:uncharacterized protein LOC143863701 isoform X2 n=1 Tax=Tasmannia lanceolata TaxID=3420 RepID=UPI0040633D21